MPIPSPFDRPFSPLQVERDILTYHFSGHECTLPVVRIDGYTTGPTLLITAGIHGAEYPGIEALVRLAAEVSPETFSGRLVLVPVANSAAFRQRSAFITPPDGKNLNRMFPGKPDGTYTEQLAHVLLEDFITRADAYIDLHSGDLVEALHPFSSYVLTDNPEVDGLAEEMAQQFGFETIIRFSAHDRGTLSHVAAALRGVPALLAEVGGQGRWSESDVVQFQSGIEAVMGLLGMLVPARKSDPSTLIYNRFDWYHATHDGLWYPSVSPGEVVSAGQKLGEVRNVFGELLQDVSADHEGLNVFMLSALSARAGDPLIGLAADRSS
jgi:predicted deacylase